MSLPICNGSYSNESDSSDVEFLCGVLVFIGEYLELRRPFFAGLCNFCNESCSMEQPLQRCGGCQLVGYCSRDCQKEDRPTHKYVCKEFPMVNGKNVLYKTRLPWEEHIAGLRQRAQLSNNTKISAQSIFRNPRVCRTCREARSDRLTDCKCACVSYCSKWCAKADKAHKEDCRRIGLIARSYSMLNEQDLFLGDDLVCEEFTPAYRWNDIFSEKRTLTLCMMIEEGNIWDVKQSLANERLSYPMSLLYALQCLPGRRIGLDHIGPLEDLSTLTLHVVNSSPLFDSKPWECFMHRLPKLKQLNVVFIIQGKNFNESFNHNYAMNLQRCKDCQVKNRIITYSVQQMLYHMYFSSQDYTEPDVVVVYGNTDEMSGSGKEEDDIHSEISYSNMTNCRDTVLVLTDVSKDLVKQGVRAVNAARPVEQLVPTQMNLFRGFTTKRANIDSDSAIINEKHYFTCLKRK